MNEEENEPNHERLMAVWEAVNHLALQDSRSPSFEGHLFRLLEMVRR
jgi:hypothetical protein